MEILKFNSKEEWLLFREDKITATGYATNYGSGVIDLSKKYSPSPSEALTWGSENERLVFEYYCLLKGLNFDDYEQQGYTMYGEGDNWATPDFINKKTGQIVEIKTSKHVNQVCKPLWIRQVNFQQYCTNTQHIDALLVAYDRTTDKFFDYKIKFHNIKKIKIMGKPVKVKGVLVFPNFLRKVGDYNAKELITFKLEAEREYMKEVYLEVERVIEEFKHPKTGKPFSEEEKKNIREDGNKKKALSLITPKSMREKLIDKEEEFKEILDLRAEKGVCQISVKSGKFSKVYELVGKDPVERSYIDENGNPTTPFKVERPFNEVVVCTLNIFAFYKGADSYGVTCSFNNVLLTNKICDTYALGNGGTADWGDLSEYYSEDKEVEETKKESMMPEVEEQDLPF